MSLADDNFRIRPGKIRDRGSARPPRAVRQRAKTFMGEVHQAIRRAGGNPNRGAGKGSGGFNARGRGAAVAAGLKGRNGWSREGNGVRTRSRRVAVKARVVKLNPQRGGTRGRQFISGKAVDAHLRYLERDGVTRDGEKGQVYSAGRDVADSRCSTSPATISPTASASGQARSSPWSWVARQSRKYPVSLSASGSPGLTGC